MTANTPATRKAKGRKFQQKIAQKIGETINLPYGKDKDVESRPMGQSGVDIRLSEKARELFNFDVEIKNQESWSIPKWITQAKKNSTGDNWLLFCKRKGIDSVVIMDTDYFFKLYEKILGVI